MTYLLALNPVEFTVFIKRRQVADIPVGGEADWLREVYQEKDKRFENMLEMPSLNEGFGAIITMRPSDDAIMAELVVDWLNGKSDSNIIGEDEHAAVVNTSTTKVETITAKDENDHEKNENAEEKYIDSEGKGGVKKEN